jgi:hypothetical protein
MSKAFSQRTLAKFEDASASVPLRALDRVFKNAGISLGKDAGPPDGQRRVQFRRYVASINQRNSQERNRLGDALGALIEEVAASKVDFLVKAAERDGFVFADGVFRAAVAARRTFAVTRVEDFALINERGKLLNLLADEFPKDAIAGAVELLESVCRATLRLIGRRAPGKPAALVDISKSTVAALDLVRSGNDDAKKGADRVSRCLQQLSVVVATLAELKGPSPRHARLAIGAAVAFAGFVAETYAQSVSSVR